MENKNNQNIDKKKEPGYIVGLWIARILWFIVIICALAIAIALAASLIRLLMWYFTLIF